MKIQTCSYRSIIRASGIYDILLMLPFAIPSVAELILTLLSQIHYALSLNGTMPEFSPFHLMFVNIMASISIVWAIIRVRTPIALYAIYDTVARVLIAIIMLIYLLGYGITDLIWIFLAAEFGWAAIQINGYFYKNHSTSLSNSQYA